jgi:beta-lactamase regulating signal transducer with metallopeptidase domain
VDLILNWLWQGGAIALAAAALVALTRPSARIRYTVWTAALALVAITPIVGVLRQTMIPAVIPGAGMPAALSAAPSTAFLQLPVTWWTSTAVIIGIWAGWAAVHGARLLSATLALARTHRRCHPLPLDVESGLILWSRLRMKGRRARLALSSAVPSAAVLGGRAPIIALAPTLLEDLSADELDSIVAHEWAHVQRRDDVAALAQAVVRVLAGWHPAVWWLDRRISTEREHACDEAVVELTGSPKQYAACLVKLASLSVQPVRPLPVVGISALGLRARVVRILARRSIDASLPRRGASLAAAAALSTLTVSIADVRLVESASREMAEQMTGEPLLGGARPQPVATAPNAAAPEYPSSMPTAVETRPGPRQTSSPLSAAAPNEPPDVKHASADPPQNRHTELPSQTNAEPVQEVAVRPLVPAHDAMPALREGIPASGARLAAPVTSAEPTPWSAASDAGVAIGRGSQKAAVATAGFFSRFGKKIASSF